jgi:hypothetical protein
MPARYGSFPGVRGQARSLIELLGARRAAGREAPALEALEPHHEIARAVRRRRPVSHQDDRSLRCPAPLEVGEDRRALDRVARARQNHSAFIRAYESSPERQRVASSRMRGSSVASQYCAAQSLPS